MSSKVAPLKTTPSRTGARVVVVGAGVGGLVSALLLSAAGHSVTVVERGASPGGKLHETILPADGAKDAAAGQGIDGGPTVLTMRWVFEAIFESVGARLEDHVGLVKADILARHSWQDGSVFDLHANEDEAADAVGRLAGAAEAKGFRAFRRRTEEVFRTLNASFMENPAPSPLGLARSAGIGGLAALTRIQPFTPLWTIVGEYFRDPRLRQLFGRYATYCGSSPFQAPGPLMLIAHVEQLGVWLVEGGLTRIADVLARLCVERGALLRYGAHVSHIEVRDARARGVTLSTGETIPADAVIFNGDPAALASGLLGADARGAVSGWPERDRSLSALTFAIRGRAEGFALSHHTVFFSKDYAAEFDDLLVRGRLPEDPTIYLCAQDRDASGGPAPPREERLFLLVNAPARADTKPLSDAEIGACETRVMQRLALAGLTISALPQALARTGPSEFAARFPGSGGALYGRSSHGWASSFQRPSAGTKILGLYLAGGAVHPGPGLPMAALSGRHAASALIADWASTARSRTAVMPGGISTRSARTAKTP